MENNLEPLDILMDKLRRQQPTLRDGNLLTDKIMEKISGQSHKKSLPSFILFVRAISSAAAVFLLALFLFQQLAPEQNGSPENGVHPVKMASISYEHCFQSFENEKTDMAAVYFCYMKHQSQRKKSLEFLLQKQIQSIKKQ